MPFYNKQKDTKNSFPYKQERFIKKWLSGYTYPSQIRDANSDQNALLIPFYLLPTSCRKGNTCYPAFGVANFNQSQARHHLAYLTAKMHLRTPIWHQLILVTFLPTSIASTVRPTTIKEQHVILLFWHISLQIIEPNARGLKGITGKINFSLLFSKPLTWHTVEGQIPRIVLQFLWTVCFCLQTQEHPKRSRY